MERANFQNNKASNKNPDCGNANFDNLYRIYFPRLYAFALKIIGDDSHAKDLVQNVFVKFWENENALQNENLEAFLFKAVRNGSLNYIRHLKVVDNLKQRSKEHYLGEELYYIDMVRDEPVVLIEEELKQQIIDVMEQLPPKCKEVFKLSRIDELKNKEIADKLGLSLKSVEKHMSKAIAFYRKRITHIPLPLILLIIKTCAK